ARARSRGCPGAVRPARLALPVGTGRQHGRRRAVSRGVEQPRGMKSLAAGLAGTATLETVGPADLASALGSGDLPVLGTPRVVALLEAAAVAALDGALAPQATSVGVAVRIRHLAPSVEGAAIRATATLVGVEGRRLLFRVEAADAVGSV